MSDGPRRAPRRRPLSAPECQERFARSPPVPRSYVGVAGDRVKKPEKFREWPLAAVAFGAVTQLQRYPDCLGLREQAIARPGQLPRPVLIAHRRRLIDAGTPAEDILNRKNEQIRPRRAQRLEEDSPHGGRQ